ncbi:MAG: ATP-binding cassette domain-containing protein [Ignavibacteria bacterium]
MSAKIDEIILKDLNKDFNGKNVIKDLSMRIPGGSKITITGKSGSGKSTLLNILMGFLMPDSGTVEIMGSVLNDQNVHKLRRGISWVPQELQIDINYVNELLILPFKYHKNKHHNPSKESISQMLDMFGLSPVILNQEVIDISGGERQRIFLAAAALLKRNIYFLDEPTSTLDSESKLKVMNYFLRDCSATIVAVTHDKEWMDNSNMILDMNNNKADTK